MDNERNELQRPYYEVEYLDDYNTRHITFLKDTEEVDFVKNRFSIEKCEMLVDF